MPIEDSEKVSINVNKVRHFLRSIEISIMLGPIPISTCKAMLWMPWWPLMGHMSPELDVEIGLQTSVKQLAPNFQCFRESRIQLPRKLPIQFTVHGFNLSSVFSKQGCGTWKGYGCQNLTIKQSLAELPKPKSHVHFPSLVFWTLSLTWNTLLGAVLV